MTLPLLFASCGIIFAMLEIWRSCAGFEEATAYLGRNMTNGVRGATFNAIGSSLPELLAASVALLFYADKSGFAFGIGTTAGSAIFNSAVWFTRNAKPMKKEQKSEKRK